MSKYTLMLTFIFISIIITLVAQQIDALAVIGEIDNTLPTSQALEIGTAKAFLNTYWNLLTFNVQGLPAIVSLLFIPMNLVSGIILLELIVKVLDLIPFT